jgi:hypothetical protein
MNEAPVPYVVRQGDTLLSIALSRGLDPDTIWNEPKNAALVQLKRRDPDVLAPGDVLYIPRLPRPAQGVALKSSNRFRASVPTVAVRLAFHAETGPLAGEPYAIDELSDPWQGVTEGALDGAGVFTIELPVWIRHFVLRFPRRAVEHTVWVGHLNPPDEVSGARQRLRHLGHLSSQFAQGSRGEFADAETERMTVEWFQRAQGIEPNGFYDEETMRRLAELAGG